MRILFQMSLRFKFEEIYNKIFKFKNKEDENS